MKHQHHRTWRSLALSVACAVVAVVFPAPASTAPNFVFLLADDLGWSDLKCYGSSFHQTPNIDRLAEEGARFTHFYSAGSVCSPTRASILTGKYPVRTGITDWIPGQIITGRKLEQLRPQTELAKEEFTFAEAFQAAGYQTIYIGKWHLGGKQLQPTDQGFDQYISGGEDGEGEKNKDEAKLKRRLYSSANLSDAATGFLQRRDEKKPFLLFLSYHDVHTPIQPIPGLVEHYETKVKQLGPSAPGKKEHQGQTRSRQDNPAYASMVAALDNSVGRIRRTLADLGLDGNTIVIFTSDNGGLATSKGGGPTSNSPLRAGKGWLYEGGIRVPLIVYAPGITKPGSIKTPLISNDFYPTLLELAGLPGQPSQHLDGNSFAGVLQGKSLEVSRPLFWHYPHYHGSTWTPGAAIRFGDWKLLEFYEDGKTELYNLKADPFESKDLARDNPDQHRKLLDRLHAWQKSVDAPLPKLDTNDDPNFRIRRKK